MIFNLLGSLYGATELQSPKDYSYNDLKRATKNFKEENKLGEGGFGDVYKVLTPQFTLAIVIPNFISDQLISSCFFLFG